MFRSLAIRVGMLCLAITPLAPLASTASAQMKIGVVNTQQAMLDSDELKKASTELEKKYKPRQDELVKLNADLQSIQQQIGSGKLNQQAVADLTAQGTRKQRDAQRLADDMNADVEKDRQDILAKMSQKMQDVINKLAQDKGLDMIIESSQLLYSKPEFDITADATAAYNKANPAK
jgi:outer membrane protein